MKHFTLKHQAPILESDFIWTACGGVAHLDGCTCDPSEVTCTLCLNSAAFLQIQPNKTPSELSIVPASRLEWDSQRMTVLCEFIVQELKDGAKIPDAIREELNDLLYLYIEPKQEA